MPAPLILASSSMHRRALLDRLQMSYEICAPHIDESRHPGEPPADYVARLSQEKAQAVATRYPQALIIGSDQAAVLDAAILGKPGTRARALEQLRQASGRCVEFYTGLTLLDAATGAAQTSVVTTRVHFRQLSDDAISRYLDKEQPYDCAGSFKSEALGIALFERIEGNDPTALIGLPLIELVSMLSEQGINIP